MSVGIRPVMPLGVVRQHLGPDGQPLCLGERPALGLEQRRLTDGVDSFGEHDRHRPGALLWFTRRAASASVRSGLPFAPEFVSALAGFR